jgi:hypothetical protein
VAEEEYEFNSTPGGRGRSSKVPAVVEIDGWGLWKNGTERGILHVPNTPNDPAE